jgi:hypothetical protein
MNKNWWNHPVFSVFLVGAALLFAMGLLSSLISGPIGAQTSTMPIPSGVATTGQILTAVTNNDVQGSNSVTVGASGTALTQILVTTATITSVNVAATSCAAQNYTVSGLTTSDKVFVNPAFTMGAESFIASANVPASDELELILCNPHAVIVDPETGTVNVVAVRS